jgi:pimeloyl-ACP methyl ester carboxylesterase
MYHSRLVVPGVAAALTVGAAGMQACAASQCDRLLERLATPLAGATCFESTDLTTNNTATTPPDNALADLPQFAFTPQSDRGVISPPAGFHTPVTKAVPGQQIGARIADDPLGEARIVIRLPDDWNGRMVVAGASGTRSEFNGDFAWSDYVVQQGYAYVSQNKGVYNLMRSASSDPLGCRLNPASGFYVHFYDNDAGQDFGRWNRFMLEATAIGRSALEIRYGRGPARTYAVGTSNGGYQVRRAMETAPDLFDGGVDWEGTFVDAEAANLLSTLPTAILNYPEYAKSGYDPASTAFKNMRAAGYPPDLTNTTGTTTKSLWGLHSDSFWEVTQCQWQKRLDPSYDTYGAGTATYSYVARLAVSGVGADIAAFATTGRIRRPLVSVAGTMDSLLPIDVHARAYARKVEAALGHGGPDYRLYEVQNGNHIEAYVATFPQLQYIEPHAQKAFELLVASVERASPLPPSQCIPMGGEIATAPAQPGHCASLLAQ